MTRLAALFIAIASAAPALAAPPANDNYAAFTSIASALPAGEAGTNVEATTEPGETLSGSMSGTVWYRWTAPATGFVETSNVQFFKLEVE